MQLTIDSRFQKAVDKALAENIDMINRVYNTGSMKAAAGAAVVLDVKAVSYTHLLWPHAADGHPCLPAAEHP